MIEGSIVRSVEKLQKSVLQNGGKLAVDLAALASIRLHQAADSICVGSSGKDEFTEVVELVNLIEGISKMVNKIREEPSHPVGLPEVVQQLGSQPGDGFIVEDDLGLGVDNPSPERVSSAELELIIEPEEPIRLSEQMGIAATGKVVIPVVEAGGGEIVAEHRVAEEVLPVQSREEEEDCLQSSDDVGERIAQAYQRVIASGNKWDQSAAEEVALELFTGLLENADNFDEVFAGCVQQVQERIRPLLPPAASTDGLPAEEDAEKGVLSIPAARPEGASIGDGPLAGDGNSNPEESTHKDKGTEHSSRNKKLGGIEDDLLFLYFKKAIQEGGWPNPELLIDELWSEILGKIEDPEARSDRKTGLKNQLMSQVLPTLIAKLVDLSEWGKGSQEKLTQFKETIRRLTGMEILSDPEIAMALKGELPIERIIIVSKNGNDKTAANASSLAVQPAKTESHGNDRGDDSNQRDGSGFSAIGSTVIGGATLPSNGTSMRGRAFSASGGLKGNGRSVRRSSTESTDGGTRLTRSHLEVLNYIFRSNGEDWGLDIEAAAQARYGQDWEGIENDALREQRRTAAVRMVEQELREIRTAWLLNHHPSGNTLRRLVEISGETNRHNGRTTLSPMIMFETINAWFEEKEKTRRTQPKASQIV